MPFRNQTVHGESSPKWFLENDGDMGARMHASDEFRTLQRVKLESSNRNQERIWD